MMIKLLKCIPLALIFITTSCMKWEYGLEENFDISASGDGLFICNEGNFQYGNAVS